MEMLPETCRVSERDSKTPPPVDRSVKERKEKYDCSTDAFELNASYSDDTIVITPFSLRRCRRLRPVAFPSRHVRPNQQKVNGDRIRRLANLWGMV